MDKRTIAYFSMEVALEASMPTYSGGLGALAGDTLRAAADLRLPMVGISLLHRKGYFFQQLDDQGHQSEAPVDWSVDDFLEEEPVRTPISIEGREVQLRAWRYDVKGISGHTVPVYFLDTNLPENEAWDRTLTHHLYGGDAHYRLCQEVVLGIGGVHMLEALGYDAIERYHMNEGHAALLTLALLNRSIMQNERAAVTQEDILAVREQCVFTTHTPVPAGHDKFPLDLVARVLPEQAETFIDERDPYSVDLVKRVLQLHGEFEGMKPTIAGNNTLNMTFLALNLSRYVNGVAKRHGEVSRLMFADYEIDAITNGVHAATWVAGTFQQLFDRHIPGWREDNFSLRYALGIPKEEIWQAHIEQKKKLLSEVQHQTNTAMDSNALTLGFARRMTPYKRGALLFTDLDRLKRMAEDAGPLQIVYAGKAHPQDEGGKETIRRIFEAKEALQETIKVAYLPNYDTAVAKLMTAGVDVWLNTPQPPNEASGTSGMKAALNGVPHLSVLDGWWVEGCIEGVTGWAIGEAGADGAGDASALYEKLERKVIPQYYDDRGAFTDVMRHAIALNGSFFNTQRMLQQYVVRAYF